jgi:hypothetical protein
MDFFFVFLCFLQVFQFFDCNHTNITCVIVSRKDIYLGVFLTSFFFLVVVCIDFNVGCFVL